MTSEPATRLKQLTNALLNNETPAYLLHPQLQDLVELFAEVSGYRHEDTALLSEGESNTPGGLAVSQKMAAMCSEDICRTITFIRGLHQAIADRLEHDPHQQVNVLYIGCGPYAVQAVPLISVFSPEQVTFSLVDIHQENLDSVSRLINGMGFEGSLSAMHHMDAAHLKLDQQTRPDIVVMEIMQACLHAEPQVSVSRHILSQAPEAVLVPEDISVQLKMVDFADDHNPQRPAETPYNHIEVGNAFTLNKTAIQQWQEIQAPELPGSVLTLPVDQPANLMAMLFTRIQVYKEHVLQNYQSGLTMPRHLATFCDTQPGNTIQFSYQLGDSPQLRATTT